MQDLRAKVRFFLHSQRADTTPHVDVSLLDHLEGTCGLLDAWGAAPNVALAGLLHTAYGTQGFPLTFFTPRTRERFADLVGPDVERLVYFYGSCDRTHLYPQFARLAGSSRRTLTSRAWDAIRRSFGRGSRVEVDFRDRFTERSFRPDASLFVDFVELSFANELEILRRIPVAEATRNKWLAVFSPCRPMFTPGARRAFDAFFAQA